MSFPEACALVEELRGDGHPLHSGVRYGLSQALLSLAAAASRRAPAQILLELLGERQLTPVPIYAQSGEERRRNVDKMILKHVDVLPHGLINSPQVVRGRRRGASRVRTLGARPRRRAWRRRLRAPTPLRCLRPARRRRPAVTFRRWPESASGSSTSASPTASSSRRPSTARMRPAPRGPCTTFAPRWHAQDIPVADRRGRLVQHPRRHQPLPGLRRRGPDPDQDARPRIDHERRRGPSRRAAPPASRCSSADPARRPT